MSTVVTARGLRLNMDELRMKARRPVGTPNVDQKDKVRPQQMPPMLPNVKGFMPSMEGVVRRIAPQQTSQSTPVEGPSMADYTGITVDRLKHLDDRPKDTEQAVNQALNEIINDMHKDRQVDASKSRRRSS